MKDRSGITAGSVYYRLRTLAHSRQLDFNHVLTRYVLERLLYRLSISPYRTRFALKGAMLFTVWTADIPRMTRDVDLLGCDTSDREAIQKTFRAILDGAADDGVRFDGASARARQIRLERPNGGIRIKANACIGTARIPVRIDIGFGDAVSPGLVELDYPTLLDGPGPRLLTCPRETFVAEKLEAIVSIGIRTSRMKDYYDLLTMARLFEFGGRSLSQAIRATFKVRGTQLPNAIPPALSRDFTTDPDSMERWDAFIRRPGLLIDSPDLAATVGEIATFVMPPTSAALSESPFARLWQPSTGWTQESPGECS